MIPRKVITEVGAFLFYAGFLLAMFLHEVGNDSPSKLLVMLWGILFLACLIAGHRKLKKADKKAEFLHYSLCPHMNAETTEAGYFCAGCRFYMCTWCEIGHKEMHRDLERDIAEVVKMKKDRGE